MTELLTTELSNIAVFYGKSLRCSTLR